MRHVFKPGDQIRAGCDRCQKLVKATYEYGAIRLDDGTEVANVMRATCNVCGTVVAIAHQSAPTIKAARNRRDRARGKLRTTVRLSRPLADYAASQLLDRGANPERLDLMLKTFVSMQDSRTELVCALREVSDPVLELPPEVTVHLDLSQQLWDVLKELQTRAGLRNLSEFVRRMLVVMDDDPNTADSMRKVMLYAS